MTSKKAIKVARANVAKVSTIIIVSHILQNELFGTKLFTDKWLYASYCEFSKASNSNILGRSRFETLLIDVCVHQLGLNVYKMKERRGVRVINLACRTSDQKYLTYPSIIEVGLNKEQWREKYGKILDNPASNP